MLLTCHLQKARNPPQSTVDVSIGKIAIPPTGLVNTNFSFIVTVEASALPDQDPAVNVTMTDIIPDFFVPADVSARPDDPSNPGQCDARL